MNRFASQLILYGGVATSAVALFLVYIVSGLGFNSMGLYWLFVVPVGAVIVGVVSGIGYAVMSKWTNYRASKFDVLLVMCVSLMTYAASHYVTYRHVLSVHQLTPKQVSFVTYMRLTTEKATMKGRHGEGGGEVGKFGYALLLLEALGFCGGAVLPLVLVSANAYCENCRRYMKKDWEGYHSSELTTAELRGKKDEKSAMITAAIQEVLGRTFGEVKEEETQDSAGTAIDGDMLEKWRGEMSATAGKKSLASVQVTVKQCDQCGRQHAAIKLNFMNVSKEAKSKDLASTYIEAEGPIEAETV